MSYLSLVFFLSGPALQEFKSGQMKNDKLLYDLTRFVVVGYIDPRSFEYVRISQNLRPTFPAWPLWLVSKRLVYHGKALNDYFIPCHTFTIIATHAQRTMK